MIQAIASIIKFILLWFGNKLEQDKRKQKKKDKLLNEGAEAIKNGDVSKLNAILVRLRK